MSSHDLAAAISAARTRIDQAAVNCGRNSADITLELAVKTQSARTCAAAAKSLAGLGLPVVLGHNRVQEALDTIAAIRSTEVPGMQVRLIGHLQSNKINHALRCFDVIETIDSFSLAQKISNRISSSGNVLPVLVQVNTSGEASKAGCAPTEATELSEQIGRLPGLRLDGFMTVGAPGPDKETIRSSYATLRNIRDQVVVCGVDGTETATTLSMGMSGDLELAIAEGATIVRIGTGVFGVRPQ